MKLKELANKYESRDKCAAEMGITVNNLNMLISRGREVEQLKDGRWALMSNKHKIFELSIDPGWFISTL